MYREILSMDDTNPAPHYGVAECQYSLKNFDAALEHAKDAVAVNPKVSKEVDYMFVIILHQLGDVEQAKSYYEKFKLTIADNKAKMADYEINKLIAQCDYVLANKDNLADVTIENLIPENLRAGTPKEFLGKLDEMNDYFQNIKQQQKENHVLRYIGDLSGNLQEDKGNLDVKLVSVPANSALGQIQGADAIFEIYTESYGEKPIVIQGAGAGAAVTARGVFRDRLRLADKS